MKLYNMVLDLLTKHPQLRDNDKKLIWTIWFKQNLCGRGYITKEDFVDLAETPESITRARRKVQEEHQGLASSAQIQAFRDLKEETKGEFVKSEEVDNHEQIVSWETRMQMLQKAKATLKEKGVIK